MCCSCGARGAQLGHTQRQREGTLISSDRLQQPHSQLQSVQGEQTCETHLVVLAADQANIDVDMAEGDGATLLKVKVKVLH